MGALIASPPDSCKERLSGILLPCQRCPVSVNFTSSAIPSFRSMYVVVSSSSFGKYLPAISSYMSTAYSGAPRSVLFPLKCSEARPFRIPYTFLPCFCNRRNIFRLLYGICRRYMGRACLQRLSKNAFSLTLKHFIVSLNTH